MQLFQYPLLFRYNPGKNGACFRWIPEIRFKKIKKTALCIWIMSKKIDTNTINTILHSSIYRKIIENSHQTSNMSNSPENLLRDLEESKTLPLWTQMSRLNPPEPNPQSVPFLWEYSQIKPNLQRAGNLITEKQAERRVLMLVNPARGTYGAQLPCT